MVGGAFLGFEGIGQLGDAVGPGYRDIFQGTAGLLLLGLGAKWAKSRATDKAAQAAADKVAQEAAAKQREKLARELSEKRIAEIDAAPKSDFPNGRKPPKTSTVIDRTTNKVYQADSGFPLPTYEEIHPELQKVMPNPSLESKWIPENCAEFKAINKALWNGAKISDLDVYTISRQLEAAPRCANCRVTTDGANVFSD